MKEDTKNISSIIEDISISKSMKNIWDDILNGSESFDVNTRFLNIFSYGAYQVRFLGPILKGKRLYVDAKSRLIDFVTPNEIKEIIEENKTVFESVINKCKVSLPPIGNSNFREVKDRFGRVIKQVKSLQASPIEILNSLFYKDSPSHVKLWQDCLFTNVYVRSVRINGNDQFTSQRVKILPIPKTTCSKLAMSITKYKNSESKKISGIYAYDLIFSKDTAERFSGNNVVLSDDQSLLTRQEISYILNSGLVDIKKAIKEHNRINALKMEKGKSLMFYLFEDYKLPEEFMSGLYDEVENSELIEQMDAVEDNLHNLPQEAMGNFQSMGSVGSLEL